MNPTKLQKFIVKKWVGKEFFNYLSDEDILNFYDTFGCATLELNLRFNKILKLFILGLFGLKIYNKLTKKNAQ